MARRTTRPPQPAVTDGSPCPCGLPAAYGACCGRFHTGQAAAPTAELLMRSRYSAFVVRDETYLLRTWHPDNRPSSLDFDPGMRWTGLEIAGTTEGSMFHSTGTVTFVARYTRAGEPGRLHERSHFERHDGAWVYVSGTFME
ncbi:YchJ family metal-binding protein [Streptomyces sp. NBC_01619]|uniref:YchJ family protein n=1 Tax=Streptomyces sp. NBC_01619 TaxID=2975901 RepID=UPI002256CED5|nr:YchJ family metal-binding protein [Streptomyces sp. NBC_01619]MCX4514304.1 YchJ family metal-binding protein [Streptomyces sp. NBC_01619]